MWNCTITTLSRPLEEGNKHDTCIIDITEKKIDLLEMARPSWKNRAATEETKNKQVQISEKGYKVQQTKIVVDVLGGFDKELKGKLPVLIGKVEAKRVLFAMQKTVWQDARIAHKVIQV